MRHLLVADIGGTHARFALFTLPYPTELSAILATPFSKASAHALTSCFTSFVPPPVDSKNKCTPPLTLLAVHEYPCEHFATFNDLLKTLKNDAHYFNIADFSNIQHMNIAAAGAVHKNTCKLTNLPWVIEVEEVCKQLRIPNVFLVNDFIAQGYASFLLKELQSPCLQLGTPKKSGPIAIIGAGTGLGKAILLPEYKRVLASEGGQTLFPFSGKEEFEYAAFLCKELKTSEIIQDAVLSGRGLEMLFTHCTGQKKRAEEISPLFDTYPKVQEWFARFYGRVCRHFVLDTYALGGLVITGGIAAKTSVLQHPAFLATFNDSAVQKYTLQQIPIHHMHHPQAGLYGAALASFYK